MAEPYRKETSGTPGSSRLSDLSDEKSGVDYQEEIAKMRSEIAKLAESVGGTVQSTMRPVTRELEATVSRNPTASVLVAAGVGLLLGIMMSR